MPKSVLFVCNQFPALSETFIYFQVEDLLKKGYRVGVIGGRPDSISDPRIAEVLRHPNLRLFYHPRIPSNKVVRGIGCLTRMALAQVMDPALAFRPGDARNYPVSVHAGRIGYLSFLDGTREEFGSYDIVHAHFGQSAEELLFWEARGRIPVHPTVVSFHGSDIGQNASKYGLGVYRNVFERAAILTANSSFTKGRMIKMGAPEEKIVILRATVDVEGCVFRPRSLDPQESLNLICIGRLDDMKGHRYVIEAVRRLREQGHNVEARFAGDGPYRERILKQVGEANLQSHIQLLGWQNRAQIRELLDWGHLLVAASVTAKNGDTEGQGVVLQEAQASGLPVIATTHNGFPDSIVPDKSGILVPEHSVEGIVDAVLKLKAAHLSWPEMGQTGRDFVLNHFTREFLLSRLLDIYERAMTSPPSSSPCAAS